MTPEKLMFFVLLFFTSILGALILSIWINVFSKASKNITNKTHIEETK